MDLGLTYVIGPDGSKTLTIPDESRAFVVSFVRDGAVKAPEAIEAIVQEGQDELCKALDGLSETQSRHKPSASDWSVLELLEHVVTVKRVVAGLTRSLSEGRWPPGIGAEWEEASAQDGVTLARFETLSEARAAVEAAHADLLGFVRTLDESTNVETRFSHFLFGALNCREWAVFQRIHDGDHTPQIAQIKASPGFPAA
jgi:hypothetical protein